MSDSKAVKWIDEARQCIREAREREDLIKREAPSVWLDLKTAIDESIAAYASDEDEAFPVRTNGDQRYVRTVTVSDQANPVQSRWRRTAVIAFNPSEKCISAAYDVDGQTPKPPADRVLVVGVSSGHVRLFRGDVEIDSMEAARYFLWPVLFPELPEPT